MAPFSASGKIDSPADDRIIALEILVSSQEAKEGFGQATCLQPDCLKGSLLLVLLPVLAGFS